MTLLEVGAPYNPGVTSYPERTEYNYRSGGNELLMAFAHPTPAERRAVVRGFAEFALVVEGPVILFCYKFDGAMDWGDAPYTYHLLPPEEQIPPPELTGQQRAVMQVVLLDAATGLIQGLRLVSFDPTFSATLYGAIRKQMALPWDPTLFDATLAGLYRRFPNSRMLLGQSIARTRAGG